MHAFYRTPFVLQSRLLSNHGGDYNFDSHLGEHVQFKGNSVQGVGGGGG